MMHCKFWTAACMVLASTLVQASDRSKKPLDRGKAATRQLHSVSDFAGIRNRRERSIALFLEADKVIESPRCLNCHPQDEHPRQGDAQRMHTPMVVRGKLGVGAPGMECSTCHGPSNFDAVGVPGNPKWRLAPASTAWENLSSRQICEQLKDPKRNGNRTMPEIVEHVSHDDLVGWGWHPGRGRTPAPGTQPGFGELIAAWVDTGAACPN